MSCRALDHALVAAVDWNLRAGGTRERRAGERSNHGRDVRRRHLYAENVAALVLLDRLAIGGGAGFEHVVRPEAGVEDGVRMDDIHADPVASELEGRNT